MENWDELDMNKIKEINFNNIKFSKSSLSYYKNLIITTSYKTGEQPLISIIRDPRI